MIFTDDMEWIQFSKDNGVLAVSNIEYGYLSAHLVDVTSMELHF